MKWFNLKNTKCPKCDKVFEENYLECLNSRRNFMLPHYCGFTITRERYNEIINSMKSKNTIFKKKDYLFITTPDQVKRIRLHFCQGIDIKRLAKLAGYAIGNIKVMLFDEKFNDELTIYENNLEKDRKERKLSNAPDISIDGILYRPIRVL